LAAFDAGKRTVHAQNQQQQQDNELAADNESDDDTNAYQRLKPAPVFTSSSDDLRENTRFQQVCIFCYCFRLVFIATSRFKDTFVGQFAPTTIKHEKSLFIRLFNTTITITRLCSTYRGWVYYHFT
jgi:hypothetical protein